jgi:Protein-disulfide isomerase
MKTNVNPEKDHIQGSLSAPVVLIMYGDYECSYCGNAYYILRDLKKELKDKLTIVFRNYPIVELHRHAMHAALAAETADQLGKFWEMHDILYENQQHLHDDSLVQYAKEIGLDEKKFEENFGNEASVRKVNEDISSGNRFGVRGTPTFFINGQYYSGDWTTSEFRDYLYSLIK